MKTSPHHHSVVPHRAALTAALLTGSLSIFAPLPAAAAAMSEPKDHVLFVGTDLAVKEDGQFYHVVGATKDSLKIEKDHAVADVHLGRGTNVRISKGVKLSDLSATISNVKTESVDRASARAQLAAMQASTLLQDEGSEQADRLQGNLQQAESAVFNNDPGSRSYQQSKAAADANKAEAMNSYTGGVPGLNLLSDSANTFLMQGVAKTGDETEVDLNFDVSSPAPIDHAYIVVVANYGSDDKSGNIARQISAREFGNIDSHPQHVTMRHAASVGGLPFKKFDIGLFADGQEVATNLSEKRTPLTTDQAYSFFLIDYLSSHQGATLPPAPMLMTPRADFRREVQNADTRRDIYASIDKTGRVLAMSADEAGAEKLPATVEAVLQNVRFMPALNHGTPVDGHLKLTLAELAN